MATVLSKGSLFPSELVNGMINQVKGASVLAQLTGATPIPFNGQTEFVFNMDNEIGIVAENAAKPAARKFRLALHHPAWICQKQLKLWIKHEAHSGVLHGSAFCCAGYGGKNVYKRKRSD